MPAGSSADENAAPTRQSKPEHASEDEAAAEDEGDELQSERSDAEDVAEELTSASAKKRKTTSTGRQSKATAASLPKKTTTGRQSLKGPASSGKGMKSGGKLSSEATAAHTVSKKKTAGRAKKRATTMTHKAGKRQRTPTAISDDDASDDESVPTTRSRSSRGYTWEAEVIDIAPEKVMEKLTYHSSIKTDIDADDDHLPGESKIKFRRDQMIYVLPDPSTLPGRSEEIGPEQLPDEEFWCARILDCCALDQGPGEDPLGLLRIAWFYSPDQAQRLEALHKEWRVKLRKHRFDEHELLASDHLDFIGVDAFCGFPEGRIEYQAMIRGLAVEDVERMKKPALREVSKRITQITGLPYKGPKDGRNVEHYLEKLTMESPEERARRKAKDARREAKEAREKRRLSQRQEGSEEEEGTDEA